ncbi:MAG: EAL domain-containing protein [Candidatus Brocadiales bacterium]|nr:EAL domain-containing protein [Candidatus Brocadiales bacterium]
MKILLVDDNGENREILRLVIEKQGNEVIEAEDGQDGLNKALEQKPDLIISDILMPTMDGFQFLKNMKNNESLKSIPFIFYSAVYTGSKDKELACSLGALAFFEKPKDPEKLWREIRNTLESAKTKEIDAKKIPFADDETFLSNYSHIVTAKLEEKVKELENEITNRKLRESRQLAQFTLTTVLIESTTLAEAAPKILKTICRSFGWEYGELWRADPDSHCLRLKDTWHGHITELYEFKKLSEAYTFSKGIGLPGRVWESGQPVWITDVVNDKNFPRMAIAQKLGIHGAMAFPITRANELIGAMGFFTRDVRQPDREVFAIMADIGRRVGAFISRRLAEELLRKSERKYRVILENLPQKIFHKDKNSVYVSCNESYARDLNISPDEITGKMDYDFYPKELADKYRADDKRIMESGQTEEIEERYIRDGREFIIQTVKAPIKDDEDKVTGILGIFWDITERKNMEKTRTRLAAILEATTDFVGTASTDGHLLYVNKAGRTMLGIADDEDISNLKISDIHPSLTNVLIQEEAISFAIKNGVWSGEAALLSRNGREIPVSQVIIAHKSADGDVEYLSTIGRDISERKRFENRIIYLADRDPLTELFNRRFFQEELERWLVQSRRYGIYGAILFLDLDNFKYVNDSLGHHVGDKLLKFIGSFLRKRLRNTDTLARLGGDEFAIILPYVTASQAEVTAKQLMEMIECHDFTEEGQPVSITFSTGIALFPAHGNTVEELLTNADLAMYHAKEKGRNLACVYTPEQKSQIESRVLWEKRIRAALKQDQFALYLQPILDLQQNCIIGHEALLRMMDTDGKEISPSNFLEIAERFGLIHDIDRWVVHKAISIIQRLQHEGKPAYLEVNLSGSSFSDIELVSTINEELSATKIDPKNLTFEITESSLVENMATAQHFIATLKASGCNFALDDFGIGFSSFNYLKYLPVDYLKIDGSFIQNLPRNHVDQHLVKAIVEVAHGLGKKTIAEFVGNEETVRLLHEFGVDYAQGYYIGKPRAVSEI